MRRLKVLALVLALTVLLATPMASHAGDATPFVYREEKFFDSDGKLLREEVFGVPWVEAPDGSKFFPDGSTKAPDGRTYLVDYATEDVSPDDGTKHGFKAITQIQEANVGYLPWRDRVRQMQAHAADEKYIQSVIDAHSQTPSTPSVGLVDESLQDRIDDFLDPAAEIDVTIILTEQPALKLPRVDLKSLSQTQLKVPERRWLVS